MSKQIRIAIAEDFELERKGLISLLTRFPNFQVVLEAGNGRELLEGIRKAKPHILLLDINMKVMDGRETFKRVRSMYPDVKIIMLTEHFDDEYIIEFISQGAAAFLSKNNRIEKLSETIIRVHDRGKAFDNMVMKILADGGYIMPHQAGGHSDDLGLSRRELEVLKLMCQGKESKHIAAVLGIESRTVEGHRRNIWKKTACSNVVELIEFAFKNNLITY